MRLGTQEMFGVEEVKGEATEASSSDSEIPLWAFFRAWVKKELKCYKSSAISLCWQNIHI